MFSILFSLALSVPAECKECKSYAAPMVQKSKVVTRSKVFGRRKGRCK